jgi:hypothetical protein
MGNAPVSPRRSGCRGSLTEKDENNPMHSKIRSSQHLPRQLGGRRRTKGSRVNRHLTSARSDIIANRQIDVWEIAFVWAFPVEDRNLINPLENALFHKFHRRSALMNGRVPVKPPSGYVVPKPAQRVQVMADSEITEKKDPALRLPRQAEHYSQIVGHFLAVKNSKEIAGAIQAHFDRLQKYHHSLLGRAEEIEGD